MDLDSHHLYRDNYHSSPVLYVAFRAGVKILGWGLDAGIYLHLTPPGHLRIIPGFQALRCELGSG